MAIRQEAWFGAYFFVGFAQNGLAPILLPLASKAGTGSGLSYASFALTGLADPGSRPLGPTARAGIAICWSGVASVPQPAFS